MTKLNSHITQPQSVLYLTQTDERCEGSSCWNVYGFHRNPKYRSMYFSYLHLHDV